MSESWTLRLIALTLGSVALAPSVGAGPAASRAVTSLVDSASLIVVGEVAATPTSATIEVERVLKGNAGLALTFAWPAALTDFSGTHTGHGIVFLLEAAPNEWTAIALVPGSTRLADQFLATPTGALPSEYEYDPEASVIDKVAAELLYTVAIESDATRLAVAYEALYSLNTPQAPSVVSHLMTLGVEDADACRTAAAIRSSGASLAITVRNRLIEGSPLHPMMVALLCETADPGAVDTAIEIANTAGVDPVVRRCALRALRNVHSTNSLATLASALESDDLDTSHLAVMGLAAYATEQLPFGPGQMMVIGKPDPVALAHSPSISDFEADPDTYRDYWRRWWSCKACELGEPGCEEAACLGYVESYTAVYDAAWTCTSAGTGGCSKQLVSYSPATYKPTPPDAEAPQTTLFTMGFVTGYGATYAAEWNCTAAGGSGCRKDLLSYTPTGYNSVGPDAGVPAGALYTYGYVATWGVGSWSGCSATTCNQAGWYTRSVWPASWKATPPDEARPQDALACGWPCSYTCYDYGLYETWAECYAAGWSYCDTRYRDDGTGGLLTCRHGYN